MVTSYSSVFSFVLVGMYSFAAELDRLCVVNASRRGKIEWDWNEATKLAKEKRVMPGIWTNS